MKKCKISLLLKGVVSLLLALLLHVEAFGQTNTSYLTWDSEVGCIEYDFRYDRKKGYVFDGAR